MRTPDYTSLDLIALAPIRDPATASQSLLYLLKRQHALMSGWGGPPQSRTLFFYAESSLVDRTISYRVPPGVTDIDVEVVASGNGPVNFATAVDAEGVTARFVDAFADDPGPESATTVRANGLRVLASPVWAFTDVEIAVEIAAGSLLQTYTLTIYPRQVPRHRRLTSYYESLDGSDGLSYLEASTNLAARLCLPGTGSIASFTLLAWVAQLDTNGRGIVQIGDAAADAVGTVYAGERPEHYVRAWRGGTTVGSGLGAVFPDDSGYVLTEFVVTPTTMALLADGSTEGPVAISAGSFSTPADLFRLLPTGGAARIRNIALMSGALTSDERTALLAAGYTHDYRTDYDDGAGHVWTGRTPPFLWCTPAILHSPIHIYTAEPGETIEASGYTSMPDPEDSTFGVWFRVTNSGDGFIVRIPPTGPGYHGLAIPSGANDGTTFDLEWHDNSYGTYAVGEWLLLTLTNDGGEITANINDSDNYNLGSEALDGDFVLGTEAGLTADIQVEFAQPFFTASRRTPTETAALYAAGHLHPVNEASGAWPALALPIVYQAGLTGSAVANGGTGATHPMSFTGTPNAVLGGPIASVMNSGTAGECDLDLYGDTTSETD